MRGGKEPGEVAARVNQPGHALYHPVDVARPDTVALADHVFPPHLVRPVGEEERGLEAPVELLARVPGGDLHPEFVPVVGEEPVEGVHVVFADKERRHIRRRAEEVEEADIGIPLPVRHRVHDHLGAPGGIDVEPGDERPVLGRLEPLPPHLGDHLRFPQELEDPVDRPFQRTRLSPGRRRTSRP